MTQTDEMSNRTSLGHGRLFLGVGIECDVSLFELTADYLIVRARVVPGGRARAAIRETPLAVDDRGGEYEWFHTVSGGGPIGDVLDWVFHRPGPEVPAQIRVFVAADRTHAAVAEF